MSTQNIIIYVVIVSNDENLCAVWNNVRKSCGIKLDFTLIMIKASEKSFAKCEEIIANEKLPK